MDVKCCFTMILIFIFLVTSDVEHFFMCLLGLLQVFFGQMVFEFLSLVLNFYCCGKKVVCIFWRLVLMAHVDWKCILPFYN